MKSCTDLEQSITLSKILSVKSADMYYPNRTDMKYQGAFPIELKNGNPLLSQEIHCWSLSALIDVIPQVKLDTATNYKKQKYWRCCAYYLSNWHSSDWYDNLIDACYEQIIKLNERKLL